MSHYQGYLERARNLLAAYGNGVIFKPVFGAAAAYIDGAIFLICGKFGVALKLPAEQCAQMIEENGGAPLKYFEKGHIKKGYVVLPEEMLGEAKIVQALIAQSMEYSRRQA